MKRPQFSLLQLLGCVTVAAIVFAYAHYERGPFAYSTGSIRCPSDVISDEESQVFQSDLSEYLQGFGYEPVDGMKLEIRSMKPVRPTGKWLVHRLGTKGDIYVCLQRTDGFRVEVFKTRFVGPFDNDRLAIEVEEIETIIGEWIDKALGVGSRKKE